MEKVIKSIMKNIQMIHCYSAIKVLTISLLKKNFHASLFQEWRGLKIQILNKGKVDIGRRLKTRDGNLILIDNGKLKIGKYCFFNRNVSITCIESIQIGDHVQIGNNVVIVDHDHDYMNGNKGFISKDIIIDDNVWIGANSTILKGVHIGENSVIAAGSVVNRDVPPYSVVGGNPAKILKCIKHNEIGKGFE